MPASISQKIRATPCLQMTKGIYCNYKLEAQQSLFSGEGGGFCQWMEAVIVNLLVDADCVSGHKKRENKSAGC